MNEIVKGAAPTPSCPICRKPRVVKFAPFCSARCAQIDLHRWLTGGYAVPGDEPPADDDPDSGETGGGRGEG
jgi:endogenous inhibitor of DNA gyrase (YacG/DUF329 family)